MESDRSIYMVIVKDREPDRSLFYNVLANITGRDQNICKIDPGPGFSSTSSSVVYIYVTKEEANLIVLSSGCTISWIGTEF